jgi:L-amino acid N-acyltransferase YncA
MYMPQVAIRPATLADIPAITAIYQPAVLTGTASFEIEPPDEAEMARRYRAIVEAGFPYLAATVSDLVVGYAYISAYRPRPAYRYSVENSVYVSPQAHRQGVGAALLDALIVRATAAGFRQMIAVIGDSAQAGSIGLHTRSGFVHCGIIRSVGYKHGRWLDGVIMQRALGEGDTTPPAGS